MEEDREQAIQRCIESLVHACECRDSKCTLTSCAKMKRVLTHTKVCNRNRNASCNICLQVIAHCCHHAKRCQERACRVPYCAQIKRKLRNRHIQELIAQQRVLMLLRRRIAAIVGLPGDWHNINPTDRARG